MSFAGYNTLRITGFPDAETRQAFMDAVSGGDYAFSLKQILPLSDSDSVDERWGAVVYNDAGDTDEELGYSNEAELFVLDDVLETARAETAVAQRDQEYGVLYRFRTHNGFPFEGIQNISALYPRLLFALHFGNDYGLEGLDVYRNGQTVYSNGFSIDSDSSPLLQRMIYAHAWNGYWWENPDVDFTDLLQLGFPERYQQHETDAHDDDEDTPGEDVPF